MTTDPPTTERGRLALALVCLLVAAASVMGYGRRMDGLSLNLAECVQEPVACEGAELYLGYSRVHSVSEGRDVSLVSWMGSVQAAPWPADAPLPSPGDSVSILASHRVGRSVIPSAARLHPYRPLKEATGAVMLLVWAGLLARWGRARWRERGDA